MSDSDTEKIVVLDNEIQAQLLGALLTDQDIPHVMRPYRDAALDGLFQGPKGWGHVEAPPEYKHRILELLKGLKDAASETAADTQDAGNGDS